MGKKKLNLEATITSRDRILSAAMLRFSKQSYEQTSLREIAADASVDVAYVHRAFGSKRQLFAEVIGRAVQADHFIENLSQNMLDTLTQRAFSRPRGSIDPLDIAVRSLSYPEAIEVHHDLAQKDFIEPLAAHLDDPAMQRAALIMAFLAGLSILKNVIGIKALRESEGGELEAMVRAVFKVLAGGKTRPRRKPNTERSSRR